MLCGGLHALVGNARHRVHAVGVQALKISSQQEKAAGKNGAAAAAETRILGHKVAAEACESLRVLVVTVDRHAAPPQGQPSIHVRSSSERTLCRCALPHLCIATVGVQTSPAQTMLLAARTASQVPPGSPLAIQASGIEW